SALLALMPSVAKSVSDSPTGYGILLGCFGAGAVLGALTLQPARARWSEESVASGGVAILGVMTAIASFQHAMVALAATMLAAGSALSGAVAARAGIQHTLLWAGLGIVATTAFGLVAKLPDATTDVSPWNHWRMPAIIEDLRPEFDEGPVLVTVEYRVNGDRTEGFLDAIHEYGRVRRRDGAYRWGVYRDLEEADRYVETFLVTSWAEHLR